MKRPREPFVTLVLSHRDSLTNTCKVFDCDCPLTNEALLNKIFADAVVYITLIPRLAATVAPKALLSRLGSCLLQACPKASELAATLLDTRARVRLSVAVHRQLNYAEVNAENVLCVNGRRRWQVNRNIQVERAVP